MGWSCPSFSWLNTAPRLSPTQTACLIHTLGRSLQAFEGSPLVGDVFSGQAVGNARDKSSVITSKAKELSYLRHVSGVDLGKIWSVHALDKGLFCEEGYRFKTRKPALLNLFREMLYKDVIQIDKTARPACISR